MGYRTWIYMLWKQCRRDRPDSLIALASFLGGSAIMLLGLYIAIRIIETR